ncbi:glycosyltransferase family 4 protein [Mariniphaga sp.]|uniref:glycosyltransferase family 4 protein n=1 Tax=Mariniphaga sp. TaxID=1954475 RepID=UPI0035688E89
MKNKILYILSSFNLYGGTPKKTLDLMKYFGSNSVLYVYEKGYNEFRSKFEDTGGRVYDGFYGKNLFRHLSILLKIIDKKEIDIVQTQFFWGEVLGFFIKLFRPKVKVIVAFVGPFKPSKIKSIIANYLYKKIDSFVYITKFVQNEKQTQFPILKRKDGHIIFNGSSERIDNETECAQLKNHSVFDIAGLVDWKNIQVLIKAINEIINNYKRECYFLYIAGEGPYRTTLEKLIEKYNLQKHVFLLGYQNNIGRLLNTCDVFAHPAYAEGFGIVIPEAMLAQKPIIVANAGALPELIEHEKTGLIVDPQDEKQWAEAIIKLAENKEFADNLASNARIKAEKDFSAEEFAQNYEKLYNSLLYNSK